MDNIELRSEKTKKMIGAVPSTIVRWGTLIISLIVIGLLTVVYFVPYPENIKVDIIVQENRILAYIPYDYINAIEKGMQAQIEFDDYAEKATITQINKKAVKQGNMNYFTAVLMPDEDSFGELNVGGKGKANILVVNQTILQKVLNVGTGICK